MLPRVLSLERHSKRRYQICICSIALGELASFQNYKCFYKYCFPGYFRCNLKYYESENCYDSSPHHILNPKLSGFLFANLAQPGV